MRVCYIAAQGLATDGWGRYTVEVAAGAKARGIEPVMVTAGRDLDPALAGVEHHAILPPLFGERFTTLRTLLKAPALRRILSTCDVVHCTNELYAPLVALALPRGIPYVLSVYGTWAIRPLETRFSKLVFAPAFQRADLILTISSYTRNWMARLIKLPRVEVLAGGVHPAQFSERSQAALPDWVGKEPVVFSAGAVKPRKGQHIALEAVAIARKQVPTLHYAMSGSLKAVPEFVDGLRERSVELGIKDYVHFLGLVSQEELVAWYQNADVFILPSTSQGSSFEGLGIVYLEAGAAGTPSVGTLNCGAEEAIIDGKTGYLVPQNDPQAAADALIKLLSDAGLRASMGEAARQNAHHLSWDHLVDRVVAIYRELT